MCSKRNKRHIYVKPFNMIINKNEAKAMAEHISCECKCKLNSKHVVRIKNGIIKHVNVNVKIIVSSKKIVKTCICENSKYL